MSLLFLDGFDHLLAADLPTKYSVSGSPTITGTGARTGLCVSMVTNVNIQKALTVTNQIMLIGVAVKVDSLVAGNELIAVLEPSLVVSGHIVLNANGTLSVYRGTGTSNLLGTTVNTFSTGTWYYVEFAWAVHSSLGVMNLYVNGVNWLTLTGQNTRVGSVDVCNGFKLTGQTAAVNKFDDLYICNAAGPSPHNTFLGPGRVETLLPNGEGDKLDWTSLLGGSKFTDVSEAQADGDTSYNYTSLAGNEESYTFGNLSAPTQRVLGLSVTAMCAAGDGMSHSIKLTAKPSSTTFFSSPAQSLSGSFAPYQAMHPINPQTGGLWTVAEVNAAIFGIKLES